MAAVFHLNFISRNESTHILAQRMVDPDFSVQQSKCLSMNIPCHSPEVFLAYVKARQALSGKDFKLAYHFAETGIELLLDSPMELLPMKTSLIFIKAVCSLHLSKKTEALNNFCLVHISGLLPKELLYWVELQKIRIFLDKDEAVHDPRAASVNATACLSISPSHPYACELRIIQTLALNQMERYEEAKKSLQQAYAINRNHPIITSIKEAYPYLWNEIPINGEMQENHHGRFFSLETLLSPASG